MKSPISMVLKKHTKGAEKPLTMGKSEYVKEVSYPKSPPDNLMGLTLNKFDSRIMRDSPKEFKLHVSNLISDAKPYQFCPRQKIIQTLYPSQERVESYYLSPGFKLLFSIGHAIHDLARDDWIARSPYGHLAWGNWQCVCGNVTIKNSLKPLRKKKLRCPKCDTHPTIYKEVDLYVDELMLVGHPDFVIKWYNGQHILYEIKTVDRKDVNFEALNSPLGEHRVQASVYYYMMKKSGLNMYPRIRFIYVDRGNNAKLYKGTNYKELECNPLQAKFFAVYKERALSAVNSYKNMVLPKRICENKTCTRAANCFIKYKCFALRGTIIDEPKSIKIKKKADLQKIYGM